MTKDKIQAIHRKVKAEGVLAPSLAKSVSVWTLHGVRALTTDEGYGLQISSEKFTAWADIGCNQTGFMRGTEQDLDEVMVKLGITL